MEEKDYKNFFDKLKDFKAIQDKQKQRGLNDFNLLTIVRKYHDEVYLHSAMIGALLDSKGLHYQDTLFLEKFLDMLDLKNFELDFNNTIVEVEYKDIDLYITDGSKHIIIENKIFAGDQPCQVMKYINIIKEQYDLEVTNDNIPKIEDIRVVYLTPQSKEKPNMHNLDQDDYNQKYISYSNDESLKKCSEDMNRTKRIRFKLKNYKVKYQKNNYYDIFDWLTNCLSEVRNITNLNEAIKQYIVVVQKVNKKYEGNVVTIEDELLKEENIENLKMALELDSKMINIKGKILFNFFEDIKNKIGENKLMQPILH